MKTKKRGQISVEYLIVLGFATFAITGVIGLAFYYVNSTQDQMKANHIQNFGKSIIENAESVYYAGPPSKITLTPYLPKGVNRVYIANEGSFDSLIINYSSSSGQNVIGFKSNIPLDIDHSSISSTEGIKNVVIEFYGNEISISEAS